MDRIFRVDFYPHEWLTLTAHQNPEQRGIYIQICSMIYAHRGKIINDPAHIARVSNCSARLARKIIDELVTLGDIILADGFISQKRCENEISAKKSHQNNSALGGKNKAKNRPKIEISRQNQDSFDASSSNFRYSNLDRTFNQNEPVYSKNNDLFSSEALVPLASHRARPRDDASAALEESKKVSKEESKKVSKKLESDKSLPSPPTPNSKSAEIFVLPDFLIPFESDWNDFMDIRKKLKAINSTRAKNALVEDLKRFKEQGFSPGDLMSLAIKKSWKSIYLPKDYDYGKATINGYGIPEKPRTKLDEIADGIAAARALRERAKQGSA